MARNPIRLDSVVTLVLYKLYERFVELDEAGGIELNQLQSKELSHLSFNMIRLATDKIGRNNWISVINKDTGPKIEINEMGIQFVESQISDVNSEYYRLFHASEADFARFGLIAERTLQSGREAQSGLDSSFLLDGGAIDGGADNEPAGPQLAPASDRFVTFDHNSSDFGSAVAALDVVIQGIEGSNELHADADERLALRREVEGLKVLISEPKARLIAVWSAVQENSALQWVAKQASGGVLGNAAYDAIKYITNLIISFIK